MTGFRLYPTSEYITRSIHDIKQVYSELNGLLKEYIARLNVNLNKVGARDNISSMEHKFYQ